jgi:hypothetical protein
MNVARLRPPNSVVNLCLGADSQCLLCDPALAETGESLGTERHSRCHRHCVNANGSQPARAGASQPGRRSESPPGWAERRPARRGGSPRSRPRGEGQPAPKRSDCSRLPPFERPCHSSSHEVGQTRCLQDRHCGFCCRHWGLGCRSSCPDPNVQFCWEFEEAEPLGATGSQLTYTPSLQAVW